MNKIIELLEISNLENNKLTKESISKFNQGNKMLPKKYTIDTAKIYYNLSYADALKQSFEMQRNARIAIYF